MKEKYTQKLKTMNLRQKLGQMLLYSFRGKDDIPQDLQKKNQLGEVGGYIFFSGSNVDNLDQVKSLTQKIQSYRAESPIDLPYLVCIDQEGGQLSAIHRGTTLFPGNMAMGFANNQELTKKCAKYMAEELVYGGISINFGPVLDSSYDEKNGIPIIDNRTFSSDPKVTTEIGSAFVEGFQDAGLIACAKHFPGQRLTQQDTHHALDVIDFSMERLQEVELAPFQRAIDKGIGAIMTHHAVYQAFENVPATLSPKVLGYLRNEMGFDGIIISDDLIMKAVIDNYGREEALLRAILAGVDLVIFTGANDWFIDYLEGAVQEGLISEERIDQSVARILQAKEQIDKRKEIPKLSSTHREEGREIALELSRQAVVCTKGKELLPLQLRPEDRLGAILANPARLVMSCTVNFYDISLKAEIEGKGYHSYVKESFMPWNPTDEESLSLFDIGYVSDVLIFTTVNGYNFTKQLEVLKSIRDVAAQSEEKKPFIIAVASRSPSDMALLEDLADVVLGTGGLTPLQITALCESIFITGQVAEK